MSRSQITVSPLRPGAFNITEYRTPSRFVTVTIVTLRRHVVHCIYLVVDSACSPSSDTVPRCESSPSDLRPRMFDCLGLARAHALESPSCAVGEKRVEEVDQREDVVENRAEAKR